MARSREGGLRPISQGRSPGKRNATRPQPGGVTRQTPADPQQSNKRKTIAFGQGRILFSRNPHFNGASAIATRSPPDNGQPPIARPSSHSNRPRSPPQPARSAARPQDNSQWRIARSSPGGSGGCRQLTKLSTWPHDLGGAAPSTALKLQRGATRNPPMRTEFVAIALANFQPKSPSQICSFLNSDCRIRLGW